jgi:hypothetical protein
MFKRVKLWKKHKGSIPALGQGGAGGPRGQAAAIIRKGAWQWNVPVGFVRSLLYTDCGDCVVYSEGEKRRHARLSRSPQWFPIPRVKRRLQKPRGGQIAMWVQ